MRTSLAATLLMLITLAACQAPPAPPAEPGRKAASRATKVAEAPRVPLEGQLRVPRTLSVAAGVRLISDRGLGLISDRGLGLISDRGVGLQRARGPSFVEVDRPRYRLQALETSAVEGARVFLADAAGQPIPDIPSVVTDAEGRFRMARVPAGLPFVVSAEVPTPSGKTAAFRSLVKVGEAGASTQIDPASTLVTGHVLEGLPDGELGSYNPAQFQRATEATSQQLTSERLPDFTDAADVRRQMQRLSQEVAELRDTLAALRQELSALKASLASQPPERPAETSIPASGAPTATATPTGASNDTPKPAESAQAPSATAPPGTPPKASSTPTSASDWSQASLERPDSPAFSGCLVGQRAPAIAHPLVSTLQIRRVAAGVPPHASPLLAALKRASNFAGVVPLGCPVWLVYLDQQGRLMGLFQHAITPALLGIPLVLPEPPQPTSPPPSQPAAPSCSAQIERAFQVGDPNVVHLVVRLVTPSGLEKIDSESVDAPGRTVWLKIVEGCPLEIDGLDARMQTIGTQRILVAPGAQSLPTLFPSGPP